MIFGPRHHHVPELNTTSTADISFMLLIFFLVTTSMDIDKGLTRQLPPAEKQEQQETNMDKNRLMAISITADNRVLIDNHPVKAKEVKPKVLAFITRLGKGHLITIDADPASSYETYFTLQNEMVAAYNTWRNKTAMRKYGRDYNHLSPKERDLVRDLCPQRIAEQYRGEKGGQP
jgi:biopolymer transport protein ExbD